MKNFDAYLEACEAERALEREEFQRDINKLQQLADNEVLVYEPMHQNRVVLILDIKSNVQGCVAKAHCQYMDREEARNLTPEEVLAVLKARRSRTWGPARQSKFFLLEDDMILVHAKGGPVEVKFSEVVK